MALPERIRIAHEPDFRTATIGTFKGGQFFADVTGAKGWEDPSMNRALAALIHIFDEAGAHRKSVIEAFFDPDEADRRRDQLIAELDSPTFGDISIQLFEVHKYGIRWGLFDVSEDDWEQVELFPEGLSFIEPWDGLYAT